MNSPNFQPISVKNPRDDSLKAFFLDTLGYYRHQERSGRHGEGVGPTRSLAHGYAYCRLSSVCCCLQEGTVDYEAT